MSEPSPSTTATREQFGGWWRRVGAYLIDTVPVVIVFWIFMAAWGDTTTTDNSAYFQLSGTPFLVFLVLDLAWFGGNWLYLQGTKGQTIGKRATGIAVHAAGTNDPIGPGLTFARQLVHVIDALPILIGYLWPIWDPEKRTFADMIMSTRVHRV